MSKPLAGAWYGANSDHYRTLGADCFRLPGIGWFARMGEKRIRGPLSTLEAAMQAADRMLADAAMVPALNRWQPIETAPKDGKTVLLAICRHGEQFSGEVWAGHWHDGAENYWKTEGWYDEADRHRLLTAKPSGPDCWQPLPEPPEAA